jgi:hypothetical protein
MNPIDKRAIAESKKPENLHRYAVVQKLWGRYSVILRKTKRDAMATYNAAKGYKSAVAYQGKIVAGAVETIPSGFVKRQQIELLCASDVDGSNAEMTIDNADGKITLTLLDTMVKGDPAAVMLYLVDLQRFVDVARPTLESIRSSE